MSFRATYDENVAFVFRTLNRFGVPERMLPDAAQEVFTVAFRARDRFEGRSTMRTWLFGIARRVASDVRRSAVERHEVLDDDGLPSDLADRTSNVAVWAERSEELRRAETILRALPEEQRIVFSLFEVEGWTGAEIARATDVSVATVHSRLRLAREGIQRSLQMSGEFRIADDPKPLRETEGELALLLGALAHVGPSSVLREKMWGSIASLFVPQTPPVATALSAKIVLPIVVAALGGAGVWLLLRHPAAPPSVVAANDAPPVAIPSTNGPPPNPLSTEQAPPENQRAERKAPLPLPARANVVPSVSAAPPPSLPPPALAPADRLRIEADAVRKTRQLLRDGDSRAALAELDRVAKLVPNGPLEEEREVLAIEALAKSGNADLAHHRADAFLFEHPQSVHAARVRAFSGL